MKMIRSERKNVFYISVKSLCTGKMLLCTSEKKKITICDRFNSSSFESTYFTLRKFREQTISEQSYIRQWKRRATPFIIQPTLRCSNLAAVFTTVKLVARGIRSDTSKSSSYPARDERNDKAARSFSSCAFLHLHACASVFLFRWKYHRFSSVEHLSLRFRIYIYLPGSLARRPTGAGLAQEPVTLCLWRVGPWRAEGSSFWFTVRWI